MNTFTDILQSPEMHGIIDLIIKAIFSVVGGYLINFINKNTQKAIAATSKDQVITIKEIAKKAVKFVEQTMQQTGNDIKLQEAIASAREDLEAKNIRIGNKMLLEYIEEAVIDSKEEFKKGVHSIEEAAELTPVQLFAKEAVDKQPENTGFGDFGVLPDKAETESYIELDKNGLAFKTREKDTEEGL